MTEAWRKYRGAPVDGTRVCPLAAVPEPGTLGIDLAGFPVLLARADGLLRAFVNACPHQYLPLDHKGDRLISADGTILRCTNHQAGFRLENGEGVEGHGIGCTLDRIPVTVDATGHVVIGETSEGGK
jgi:nitrite reductase/ring-hydroxylating ferredoxin subunit